MKKRILLICSDEEYISTIEYKLASIFDGRAEIEIATDFKYMQIALKMEKSIILVQEKEAALLNGLTDNTPVFYLVEDQARDNGADRIFKYASIKTIAERIDAKSFMKGSENIKQSTEVVGIYSACGGSGLTLAALSIANDLHLRGKKVIYISTTSNQDYSYYINNKENLGIQFAYQTTINMNNALRVLLPEIKNEGFDFLPPYTNLPVAYQVGFITYVKIIEFIKEKNIYDYIVVELDSNVETEKLTFLKSCDKVIAITLQDDIAVKKLDKLLNNVPELKENVQIVCNRFRRDRADYLRGSILYTSCEVCEYVDEIEGGINWNDARNRRLFDKTAGLLQRGV